MISSMYTKLVHTNGMASQNQGPARKYSATIAITEATKYILYLPNSLLSLLFITFYFGSKYKVLPTFFIINAVNYSIFKVLIGFFFFLIQ